jgi:2-aminoethylphosphonate-pyruvate transaminase
MDRTAREPFLLTPGPLTTTRATKEAMLRDWGSRDGGSPSWSMEMALMRVSRCRAAGPSSSRP